MSDYVLINGDKYTFQTMSVTATGDSTPKNIADWFALISAKPVTFTSRSGTVTTGGVAQTIAAANSIRKGFWLQNISAGDIWIRFTGTASASQPSLWLPTGTIYELPENLGFTITEAISLYGATTGQAFSAMEW